MQAAKTLIVNFHILVYLILSSSAAISQTLNKETERIQQLEIKLDELSQNSAQGLSKKIDFAVSGVSIKEFLRGIAETADLNINVDAAVEGMVYNNFTNELAKNILLFICEQNNLDIRFSGSIMSFYKHVTPEILLGPKDIRVDYNAYNELISLDISGDTLDAVARAITRKTGKNVVLSPGLGSQTISVFIERMPFSNALDKLAFANNLQLTVTKDQFYLLEPIDPVQSNGSSGRSGSSNNFSTLRKASGKRAGKLNLYVDRDSSRNLRVHADLENTPLSEVLKEVFGLSEVSYFLFSEPKSNVTLRLNNARFNDFLTHLLSGTEYTYKVQGEFYLIGERTLEGLRDSKVLQLKYRAADAIIDVIPNDIKKGVEIKLFKELNSLLLSGSSPQIEEITRFVYFLDKVVPMVLIEVVLVDVRKGHTVETGIGAGLSDSVRAGGSLFPELDYTFTSNSINRLLTNLNSNGIINLGRVTPNFYVSLRALERNEDINIRSTPKLATLNGHEASLTIGEKIYYVQQTQNVIAANNPQTTILQQFQQTSADTRITINPLISADDQVTLLIDAEFSEFIPSASPNIPPGNATRQFKSMIRVRNEEMVVLGGLEQESRSRSGRGVPVLSRIPLIKWLFSSRSDNKRKTKLIIFIKPTIIY